MDPDERSGAAEAGCHAARRRSDAAVSRIHARAANRYGERKRQTQTAGSRGVTRHLKVFAKLHIPNGPTISEKPFHLAQHERVALDCRRMMRFVDPDLPPNLIGLGRGWQPTTLRMKFRHSIDKVIDDRISRGAPDRQFVVLHKKLK